MKYFKSKIVFLAWDKLIVSTDDILHGNRIAIIGHQFVLAPVFIVAWVVVIKCQSAAATVMCNGKDSDYWGNVGKTSPDCPCGGGKGVAGAKTRQNVPHHPTKW